MTGNAPYRSTDMSALFASINDKEEEEDCAHVVDSVGEVPIILASAMDPTTQASGEMRAIQSFNRCARTRRVNSCHCQVVARRSAASGYS